ncbi:MAG: hypothetical protein WB973_08825 [Thermoanaerobaculia bacterium]
MAGKKVAVVVVHGVADQQPSDSARQIANLLTDLCPHGTYSTFQEEKIRIPVEKVKVGGPTVGHRAPFEERNDDAILRHRGSNAVGPDPEHGFMRDQLRDYANGPKIFETVRLDGQRNENRKRGEAACDVHVYEAYWADLSRLGQSIFVFFEELYQLLLHLPSLGRNAVDYARAENNNKGLWPLFSWLHRWSVRWLTLFIVVLNLTMATLVLPLLVPRLLRTGPLPAVPASTATAPCPIPLQSSTTNLMCAPPVVNILGHALLALAAIGIIAWLLHRRRPISTWLWTLAPVLAAATGWAVANAICGRWGAPRLLLIEVWALSAFLIALLLATYEGMRRGALLVGTILLIATGAAFFWRINAALNNETALSEAVVQVAQMIDIVLQIAWRIHVPWMLVTFLAGIVCAATTTPGWRKQAWNTAWTSRATLTLSTALFANLTLAVWTAVFKSVQNIVPATAVYRPVFIKGPLPNLLCLHSAPTTINCFLKETLMVSASQVFIFISIVFGLFVIGAVWSILPSVLVESNPPKTQEASTVPMHALGVWLTRGLSFIPWTTEIFTALFAYALWKALVNFNHCVQPGENSWKAISAAAAMLLALISARFWLPGARGALDIIIDVDNYLRQHPKKNTPRARIAARFASLLNFVLNEHLCNHSYDSVIIIAHSQGTVIVADLLRFLNKEKDPLVSALAAKNVAFFTMGNPLRQLYARAFSGLYPWVWPAGRPALADVGVAEWINAYYSGDYVGRFVWEDKNAPSMWYRRDTNPQDVGRPTLQPISPDVTQMCLGEGAHTHYWDDRGGDDVAWMLDKLIAKRC